MTGILFPLEHVGHARLSRGLGSLALPEEGRQLATILVLLVRVDALLHEGGFGGELRCKTTPRVQLRRHYFRAGATCPWRLRRVGGVVRTPSGRGAAWRRRAPEGGQDARRKHALAFFQNWAGRARRGNFRRCSRSFHKRALARKRVHSRKGVPALRGSGHRRRRIGGGGKRRLPRRSGALPWARSPGHSGVAATVCAIALAQSILDRHDGVDVSLQ
mmetsp:Transcript_31180/g.85462  ORF Transcript_31180/g.85462 Transcript_31180/m.85462 type:complete len:217 (-) Transcript_31180:1950-2600(-)